MGKLYEFPGGVRLEGHKEMSTDRPIIQAELPKRLFVPLNQHIGTPAEAIVSKGDKVKKGQLIGTTGITVKDILKDKVILGYEGEEMELL